MAFFVAAEINESGKQEMKNRGTGLPRMDGSGAPEAVRSAGARSIKRDSVQLRFPAFLLS
jgi:hypothetical protein